MNVKEIVDTLSTYKEVWDKAAVKSIQTKKEAIKVFRASVEEGENYKGVLLEELMPYIYIFLKSRVFKDEQFELPDNIEILDTGLYVGYKPKSKRDKPDFLFHLTG